MGVTAPYNPGPNRKERRWRPSRRKGTKVCTKGRLKSGVCQRGCFGSPKRLVIVEA